MITVENVLEMWKNDSEIDDINLDDSTKKFISLHAKYLEMLSISKLNLKRKEMAQQELLKAKWLWYTNRMSKEEMDKREWKYDPFDGNKVLKSEMEYYYNADEDLQKQDAQITYIKTLIETLKEIVDQLRWRHTHIKNIIAWRQFTSGG